MSNAEETNEWKEMDVSVFGGGTDFGFVITPFVFLAYMSFW